MNDFTFSRAVIALVLLVFLSVLGGCGSGSSADSNAAPQPSSSQTPAPSTTASNGKQTGQGEAKRGQEKKNPVNGKKNGTAKSNNGQKVTGAAQDRRSRSEKVVKSLQKLVEGEGGNGGKEVVASSKNVRKIIKELMEGSDTQGSPQHGGNSIESAVEEVFGDR